MRLSSELRLATPQDIPALLNLAKKFHEESPYADLTFSPENCLQHLNKAVSDKRTFLVVVSHTQDDVPTGMLIAHKTTTPWSSDPVSAELAWYVYEDYRKGRLALDMLSVYEAWSKAVGCKAAQVSKLTTSRHVDRLYRLRGYVEVETAYKKEL